MTILWEEYREVHPKGYGYSRFCDLLRGFERRLTPVMRQHHVAGEKAFVDYSGKRIGIADPTTVVKTSPSATTSTTSGSTQPPAILSSDTLALRNPGPSKQPGLQSLFRDVLGQRPCQPGRCRPLQIVLDRQARHAKTSPDLARAHPIVVKPQ